MEWTGSERAASCFSFGRLTRSVARKSGRSFSRIWRVATERHGHRHLRGVGDCARVEGGLCGLSTFLAGFGGWGGQAVFFGASVEAAQCGDHVRWLWPPRPLRRMTSSDCMSTRNWRICEGVGSSICRRPFAGAVYQHLDPGPAPPASSPATSRVMRRTRRSGTRPELALRSALRQRGLRFVVDRPVPGGDRRRRADILLRGARIAVFVDGCSGTPALTTVICPRPTSVGGV
jgi:hypothetical protein